MSHTQVFAGKTFPDVCEQALVGPLFRPFAEQLLARVEPQPGDQVLDVACGTGIVARIARERLGLDARIVGVDLSPAMLAVARVTEPSVDWREGPATALPSGPGEQFSVVTCHQGLQFVADKPTAIREMRRVLAPGGRVAIATWSSLDDMPAVRALNTIVERHLGPIEDRRHSLGDTEALRQLLDEGGFSGVRVEQVARDVAFPDGALYIRLSAMAAIGMSDEGKAMSEEERAELATRVVTESAELLEKGTRDGMFVLPIATSLAVGRLTT